MLIYYPWTATIQCAPYGTISTDLDFIFPIFHSRCSVTIIQGSFFTLLLLFRDLLGWNVWSVWLVSTRIERETLVCGTHRCSWITIWVRLPATPTGRQKSNVETLGTVYDCGAGGGLDADIAAD